MIVLVVVIVVVVALFAFAAGNDLYWRRRGFRTQVRGRGSKLQRVRVPIEGVRDDPRDDPEDGRS